MIITRTPLRVSFSGGGTDLSDFYLSDQGQVVSTAINKYVYITINRLTPYFKNRILLKYSQTELVDSIEEIEHPIIREAMRLTNVRDSVEISSMADIPSGTGLGSSSSFTVGLLHALHAFRSQYVSSRQLAEEACAIEIDVLREPIGKQDQYIAAYGGICDIRFNGDESVFVDHVLCKPSTRVALQNNLLMFFTGTTRRAGSILEVQKATTNEKREVLTRMKALCSELLTVLREGHHLYRFGEILHQGWLNKRALVNQISNDSINEYYNKAIGAGAIGGKLLGAGGGGFLLFYVEPQNQDQVRRDLDTLPELHFGFEPQGSKVIYVSDEI